MAVDVRFGWKAAIGAKPSIGYASAMVSDTARRLLDDISDDWYALWEVDALLSRLAPEFDATSRQRLVHGLVEQGVLQLMAGKEWSEVRNAPALPTSDALTAISSSSSWKVPSDDGDPIYAVGVTAAGV